MKIHSNKQLNIPGDYLVHGQALNISCESGHQTQSKHTYNVFRCLGNKDEEAAKMLLTPCESKFTLYNSNHLGIR